MSQVVSIRLSDDVAVELEKRGKSRGENLGPYIQEILTKLAEKVQNEAPSLPVSSPPLSADPHPSETIVLLKQILREVLRERVIILKIAEAHNDGDQLERIYQESVQQAHDCMERLDAYLAASAQGKTWRS